MVDIVIFLLEGMVQDNKEFIQSHKQELYAYSIDNVASKEAYQPFTTKMSFCNKYNPISIS